MAGPFHTCTAATAQTGIVLEAWQEPHANRVHDSWPPAVAALLARVRVVRLGGELTLVDVPLSALRAMQEHLNRRRCRRWAKIPSLTFVGRLLQRVSVAGRAEHLRVNKASFVRAERSNMDPSAFNKYQPGAISVKFRHFSSGVIGSAQRTARQPLHSRLLHRTQMSIREIQKPG